MLADVKVSNKGVQIVVWLNIYIYKCIILITHFLFAKNETYLAPHKFNLILYCSQVLFIHGSILHAFKPFQNSSDKLSRMAEKLYTFKS